MKTTKLFNISREKHAWGLDIGESELRAARVRVRGGELFVDKVERIEFSVFNRDGALEGPDIIKRAISSFVVRNNISKTDKIIACIPGKTVLLRFVSLPPIKRRQVPDAIKFELRKQIPFNPDEVLWDTFQSDKTATGKKGTEVGIFATRKENVYRLLSNMELLKMNLLAVQTPPVAIYNLLARVIAGTDGKDAMVVNVGKDGTDFIVVGKYRFWNRNIPVSEVNSELVHEIQRSIGYYVSLTKVAKPDNIFLMGEAVGDADKLRFIENGLDCNVTPLKLSDKIKFTKESGDSLVNENTAHGFAVPVGLALNGIGHSKVGINLLPYDYISERLAPKRRKVAVGIAVLVLLTLFSQGLKDFMARSRLSLYAETVKLKHNKVGRYEREYRRALKEVKAEEEKLKAIESVDTQGRFLVEAIHNIIEMISVETEGKIFFIGLESHWDVPYTESDANKEKHSNIKKRRNSPQKSDQPTKVLAMSIKGESYGPGITYIDENVKKPLEDVPAFRDVEIISIRNVETLAAENVFIDTAQTGQLIEFKIRWIVDTLDKS